VKNNDSKDINNKNDITTNINNHQSKDEIMQKYLQKYYLITSEKLEQNTLKDLTTNQKKRES